MEEPGEQCTVVYALVYPPLSGFVTIQEKTTVHCSPDSSMAFPDNHDIYKGYKAQFLVNEPKKKTAADILTFFLIRCKNVRTRPIHTHTYRDTRTSV